MSYCLTTSNSRLCASLALLASLVMLPAAADQHPSKSKQPVAGKGSAKLSLNAIQFDTKGWKIEQQTTDKVNWQDGKPEVLSLRYFSKPPDIPCDLNQIKRIRDVYRVGFSKAGAGLVSVDAKTLNVAGKTIPYLKTIIKRPQSPSGMLYIGTLIFPFADFSYTVTAQAIESGISGMRDSLVADKLMDAPTTKIDENSGRIIGWAQDPYDANFKGPALRNKSEDEKNDSQCPNHPLSRVRAILDNVIKTVRFDNTVLSSAPFRGPHL
jgi:hypothetical protein